MRIIAFITFSADMHKILDHIGVDSQAPRITPARGPPLWDECGAQEPGEGVDAMLAGILPANQPPTTPKISAQTGEPADLKSDDCAGVGLCPQPSFACRLCRWAVGGKTLGIQIATSRKARLLRTFSGAILGLMRLNFLNVHVANRLDLATGLVRALQ